MADTPDDLLAAARQAWRDWLAARKHSTDEYNAAANAQTCWYALDALLSSGGPLPAAWATAAKPGEQPASLWRVVWEDDVPGQGHDVVEAPTAYHAVWEVASGYKEEFVNHMSFVRVEAVSQAEVARGG